MRRSDVSRPAAVAVVNHTRPPETAGDDHPRPGTGIFHATFFDSLHSIGSPRSGDCPWPPGPRNCGQSCLSAEAWAKAGPAMRSESSNQDIGRIARSLSRTRVSSPISSRARSS
jgi:hypothetical protein